MRIIQYTPDLKLQWDSFVNSSKNATFLLMRDYMEYHAERFTDSSYVFIDEQSTIIALLPANIIEDRIISHGGLTYGGLILGNTTSADDALEMFSLLRQYLRAQGITKLIYKTIPHIYHTQPAEEDLYALFRNDAKLHIRNLSTAINLRDPIPSSRLGKRAAKRQKRFGIRVSEVETVDDFWDIVIEDRRIRHNVKPVHTAAELNYLKSKFPDNIRLYTAIRSSDNEILGGAVIYLDKGVIHLQYAACTSEGKDCYATDVIYHELIHDRLRDNDWFDFGISNEDAGRYLNTGMVHHKEEFGGRSIIYDIYEMNI